MSEQQMREAFWDWVSRVNPRTGHKNGNVMSHKIQEEAFAAGYQAALRTSGEQFGTSIVSTPEHTADQDARNKEASRTISEAAEVIAELAQGRTPAFRTALVDELRAFAGVPTTINVADMRGAGILGKPGVRVPAYPGQQLHDPSPPSISEAALREALHPDDYDHWKFVGVIGALRKLGITITP